MSNDTVLNLSALTEEAKSNHQFCKLIRLEAIFKILKIYKLLYNSIVVEQR